MQIRSKFWFEDDEGEAVFGEGRKKMLELIEELGSMQAAAKTLGMSYRGVWARIKATEKRLNIKLIETSVGRGRDKGSRLTPEAKKLLRNFQWLIEKGNAYADDLFDALVHDRALDIVPVVPAVAVAGRPGSENERLVRNLVDAWSERGRKIGVIRAKSLPEPSETEDEKIGSWELETDGVRMTLDFPPGSGSTPEMMAANYCPGCDLALVETGERQHLPTIEVFRNSLSEKMITRMRKHILAVVGDRPESLDDSPFFDFDDIDGIINLVENRILLSDRSEIVRLMVNGHRVPMLPFVRDIFEKALTGMVTSLKSVHEPRDIELTIHRKPD